MNSCPKCGTANIINIDMMTPPRLFECLLCGNRFHTLGFTPSEIDAKQSLAVNEQLTLNSLLNK